LKRLRTWAEELAKDNAFKEGKPFTYPTVLFQILGIERNLGKSLRMTEGFARTICGLLGVPAPRYNTIWYRLQTISFTPLFNDPPIVSKRETIDGAVDSTGLKLNGPREYLQDRHHPSKKKEFVKLHALVNTKTHQILVKAVTPGYAHDSPQFVPLVKKNLKRCKIRWMWADKAYGGHDNFEVLSVNQIGIGIALKKNARSRTRGGSFARSRTAWEIKRIGERAWKEKVGYGNRWAVERSYSIYKMLFRERLQSRKWPYIVQEISLKVEQMNHYLYELYLE
jgi:hypothetical protein